MKAFLIYIIGVSINRYESMQLYEREMKLHSLKRAEKRPLYTIVIKDKENLRLGRADATCNDPELLLQ